MELDLYPSKIDNLSMFYEVYSRIEQIEVEFRDSILNLLSHEVPNLEWLAYKDGLNQGDPLYYLFFTKGKNEPVGIMRLLSKQVSNSIKPRFIYRFLKEEPTYWLNCECHGVSGLGFFFAPEYEEQGLGQVKQIIEEKAKTKYHLIQVNCPDRLQLDFSFRANKVKWYRPGVLFKNARNFNEYLKSLSKDQRESFQVQKQSVEANINLELKITDEFKEMFRGHEVKNQEYQRIRKHPLLKIYEKQKGSFFGFFHQQKLMSFAVIIPGKKGQGFFDFFSNLHEEMNSSFNYYFFMKVIEQFYEFSEVQKLRPLNCNGLPRELKPQITKANFSPINGKTYVIPTVKKSKTQKRKLFARA